MPSIIGIDLSSHAIDLVKLDEQTNQAEWRRVELPGKLAWDRTLTIAGQLHSPPYPEWLQDVYLVAIEAPYGRGKIGVTSVLNRVLGAVIASLPADLRVPERCWLVKPHEWKTELGLKGKPGEHDMLRLVRDPFPFTTSPRRAGETGDFHEPTPDEVQNGRDAYCLALYARTVNQRGIEAA